MPPHRERQDSSGEEVIRGKAFSGIPDTLDCPGIDVLESPSKCLPELSFLRVSCKKPKSLMYFSRKTVSALNCYKNFRKITGLYSIALLIAGVWARALGSQIEKITWWTPPPPPPATAAEPMHLPW